MPQPPNINDDEGGQPDETPSSSSRQHPPSSFWRQGRRIDEPQETPEPTSREDRQRLQLQPIQPRSPSDQPPFQAYRQPQRTPSGGPYPNSLRFDRFGRKTTSIPVTGSTPCCSINNLGSRSRQHRPSQKSAIPLTQSTPCCSTNSPDNRFLRHR